MSAFVLALMLGASFIHASWNSLAASQDIRGHHTSFSSLVSHLFEASMPCPVLLPIVP